VRERKRMPALSIERYPSEKVILRIPTCSWEHDIITVELVRSNRHKGVAQLRFTTPRLMDPVLSEEEDDGAVRPLSRKTFTITAFEDEDHILRYAACSGVMVIKIGILSIDRTSEAVRLRFAAPRSVLINREEVDRNKFRFASART